MQFVAEAIGHVLVFGVALLALAAAVAVESAVRKLDWTQDGHLRAWSYWGGLALIMIKLGWLHDLAGVVGAWVVRGGGPA